MKILDVVGDALLTAGCVIGVGFLSGKELVIFVGDYRNILLFCVVFGLANFCLRAYANSRKCQTVTQLLDGCFAFSGVIGWAMTCCYFVCLTTIFAGLESCLQSLLGINIPFPLFSFVVAIACSTMAKENIPTLKIVNALSIVLVIVCFVVLSFHHPKGSLAKGVSPTSTTAYALFNVTSALAVTCKQAQNKGRKFHITSSILSSILVGALLWWGLNLSDANSSLPLLGNVPNLPTLILLCATILLCTVTCALSNALPICQALVGILPREVCPFVVFCTAVVFSLFGFNFALKYGHLFVDVVGAVIICKCATTMIIKKPPKTL